VGLRVGGTHLEEKHSVELADPNGFFAYLQRHPEEARVFGEAMAAKAQTDITTVLDAYDFRPFKAIADVGGGRGHLLGAILEAVPTARGVLFELPSVIDTIGLMAKQSGSCVRSAVRLAPVLPF
jgi:O-methyltransferase domain